MPPSSFPFDRNASLTSVNTWSEAVSFADHWLNFLRNSVGNAFEITPFWLTWEKEEPPLLKEEFISGISDKKLRKRYVRLLRLIKQAKRDIMVSIKGGLWWKGEISTK